jgi:hypothetical protein
MIRRSLTWMIGSPVRLALPNREELAIGSVRRPWVAPRVSHRAEYLQEVRALGLEKMID